MDGSGPDRFLLGVPTFASFAQIADPDLYVPLPDGWLIGIADVVDSTAAVAAGRYKEVNLAGAAVISAVANALGHGTFPYVFGGDGSSFAVPPAWAAAAEAALAATVVFAREELGLALRAAVIPIRDIRDAGLEVRVARFAASENIAYAMFSGGGLAWAEEQAKAGRYAVPAAPAGTRPDLSGLSCSFDRIPARRGVVLSLIARPVGAGDTQEYRRAISDLLDLVERSHDGATPIPEAGPVFRFTARSVDLRARASRKPGEGLLGHRIRSALWAAFTVAIFRLGLRVGRFEPRRYLGELVANSDYRKYDDGLRMTLDCTPALADAIEADLAAAGRSGILTYGLHRQDAAIMTCFTPSVHQTDHVHFVDGALGGYAAAASSLKAGTA